MEGQVVGSLYNNEDIEVIELGECYYTLEGYNEETDTYEACREVADAEGYDTNSSQTYKIKPVYAQDTNNDNRVGVVDFYVMR